MTRSVGLAHIIRQQDGTSYGVWGIFTLRTAFQPIFAFRDGKLSIAAFEGLVRPQRGDEQLSPGQFFPLVPARDRFHVETLMRTLHLLNAGVCLDRAASILVNFDPSLFVDRALADTALRDMRLVLHEAGISPERIVCEVTEQTSHSSRALVTFVEALRAHGFRIAVDDYGAEDSDIRRIETLRPDIVKFDAHWITRLMDSSAGMALLSTMVRHFEDQDIRTVFEGLEEGWQLEMAEQAGVSMVQGYVLARPEIAPTSFATFARSAPAIARPDGRKPESVLAAVRHKPAANAAAGIRATFGKRTR